MTKPHGKVSRKISVVSVLKVIFKITFKTILFILDVTCSTKSKSNDAIDIEFDDGMSDIKYQDNGTIYTRDSFSGKLKDSMGQEAKRQYRNHH